MRDEYDSYGYPMPVDVVSVKPLSSIGMEWSGVVRIKTFRTDYKTRPDSETGEIRTIKQVKLETFYDSEE
jgi:hypothetical protein